MKLPYLFVLTAVAAVAAATPHLHGHRHGHELVKRGAGPDNVVYAPVAVETLIVYMLEGHMISEDEVRQGIANGTLMWGDDGILSSSSVSVTLATPAPAPPQHDQNSDAPTNSQGPALPVQQSSEQSASPTGSPPFQQSSGNWADLVDKDGYCASCDKEFPNGKLPCSQFPLGYGALPLSHEGLGGWSGIQDPQYRGGDGFDDITTIPKGSCSDGSCCDPGSFCSYGCPNPYLKLSFPKKQGRTGQSVGGLYCNDQGFLEMANGSIGKTLCGYGSRNMTVRVHNRLAKAVSICRTDYPGTESMTFPLTVKPGENSFLANPDQGKYFFWEGKPTTAHYYVNKQGVPEDQACTWGNALEGKGNWSPTIFGTSWDDINMNTGFSSLKQNELSKSERLDYDITFTGDAVVAPCKYRKASNKYCQGDDCWDDKDRGCTASIKQGGTLVLVLSDDN